MSGSETSKEIFVSFVGAKGKPHFRWTATKIALQKEHTDPNKPLVAGNDY